MKSVPSADSHLPKYRLVCYTVCVPNAKRYQKIANLNKRKKRRRYISLYGGPPDVEFIKLPTFQEIKDALGNVRGSTVEILRLAALMDNLSLYVSPRLTDANNYTGRTCGIRKYLAQDGYLISRYATLMRFKKLGRALREKANILNSSDLLWGLMPKCPFGDEESNIDWQSTRKLFSSFEGMNFKEIKEQLK